MAKKVRIEDQGVPDPKFMFHLEPKGCRKNCDRSRAVWYCILYTVPGKLPSKTRFGQFQLKAKAHWLLKYLQII